MRGDPPHFLSVIICISFVLTLLVADAFTTHPPSEQRVNQMHEMATTEKLGNNTAISSKSFDEIKRSVEQLMKSKKS